MLKTMNTMMITSVLLVAELEKVVGKVLAATNAKELVAIQNNTGMTIMNSIKAMKQALEALENASDIMDSYAQKRQDEAIISLRQAIAEAEKQEPFGYFKPEPFGWTDCAETDEGATPLYTSTPQRQPLPMEQIVQFTYDIDEDRPATMAELFRFARAIEAAHGIKGEA